MEKIRHSQFLEKRFAELSEKTGYTVDFLRRMWVNLREGSDEIFEEDYSTFEAITLERDW